MHDLRLMGVDDPGTHLLLGDDDGNRFRVPVDEGLRAATRREPATALPHQRPVPTDAGAELRPKDVQAMIRAGHPAQEVAERAGWTVEKVHRYEGPILGERAYVAGLARQVRLRPRPGAHAPAATLEARVAERMQAREIEPATATWDSLRTPTGRWSVVVFFTAGGRERQARWEFDQLARTVSASDDEARWLSEDEDSQTPGPIPAPHLQAPARPSRVYDVEAEGGIEAPQRRRRSEPVDLMSAMRERSSQRGRRRRSKASEAPGLDRVPGEALPLEDLAMAPEQAGEPPAAHPRPEPTDESARPGTGGEGADNSGDPRPPADVDGPEARGGGRRVAPLVDEPLPLDVGHGQTAPPGEAHEGAVELTRPDDAAAADAHADPEGADDGVATPSEAQLAAADPAEHDTSDGVAQVTDEALGESQPPRRTASRKSGRPSVPSWDDIMFGRKSD